MSRAWTSALDDPGRSAWSSAAGLVPRKDSLGQTYYQTGHQYFVAVNSFLMNVGLAIVMAPPGPIVEPFIGVEGGLIFSITSSTAADMSLSWPAQTVPTQAKLEMSPPQSSGVSFCGDYRYLTTIAMPIALVPGMLNFTGFVTDKFGPAAVGQKYFMRTTVFSVGGSLSSPQTQTLILNG